MSSAESPYIIEALKSQSRKDFDCGEDELNRYIKERATQDIKRKLNTVFVIREKTNDIVIGFYTLSSASITAEKLPPSHVAGLPKYPISAALLGKLAVDKAWQKRGIGSLLVADAIVKVKTAGENVAFHVLLVDAKTNELIPFYKSLGFIDIPPEKRLFLFMRGL